MDRVSAPQQLEFLLDTERINEKYAERADNPLRYITGSTRVDRDCVGAALKSALYEAAWKFIDNEKKQGWELQGTLHFDNPRTAKLDTGVTDLGAVEYRITGVFKYQGPPRTIRTELDPAIIKQAPDHTINAADAQKAWGHI